MLQHKIHPCVPIDELEAYMRAWEKKRCGCVRVESIGKSGGYDILSAVFTDMSVSDEDKQTVLVIAQHSGMEITGMSTVLTLGNYLAAKPEAEELLKKLTVVLVPCPNPYSYAKQSPAYQFKNEAGVDEYTSFGYSGAREGDKTPSATALQALIDAYMPELLLDVHGVWYDKQLVSESFGQSAFGTNRPYHTGFMKRVQEEATKAGFASDDLDFFETLLQSDRSCGDADINAMFYPTASGCMATTYSYLRYHTIGGSLEIAWEQSGLARLLAALKIGCEVWDCEEYAGFPTRTVVSPYGHCALRAYGTTARERRESRVELWQNRASVSFGVGHPEMPGTQTAIIATDPAVAGKYISYYKPLEEIAEQMHDLPGADADAMIKTFTETYPFHAEYGGGNGRTFHVTHGYTVRFMLPFSDAGALRVSYNGVPQKEDARDGYTVTRAKAYTFVDLHVPPEKVAPFALAAVRYDCEDRHTGVMEF